MLLSTRLLLAFAVLTGIFVEQCDLKDIGVADFASKVTVTNISEQAEAFVSVGSRHGAKTVLLEAGTSRTVALLAATTYTIKVAGHAEWGTYRDQLLGLRSYLQDLTLSSTSSPDDVADAAVQLTQVQAALDQLVSDKVQSCSGKLDIDVVAKATVKLTQSSGTDVWELTCH